MTKELLLCFGLIAAIPLIPVAVDAQGAPKTSKYQAIAPENTVFPDAVKVTYQK